MYKDENKEILREILVGTIVALVSLFGISFVIDIFIRLAPSIGNWPIR